MSIDSHRREVEAVVEMVAPVMSSAHQAIQAMQLDPAASVFGGPMVEYDHGERDDGPLSD